MRKKYRIVEEKEVIKNLIALYLFVQRSYSSNVAMTEYLHKKLAFWRKRGLPYEKNGSLYLYDPYEVVNYVMPAWRFSNDDLFFRGAEQAGVALQQLKSFGEHFGKKRKGNSYTNILTFTVRQEFVFNANYLPVKDGIAQVILPLPLSRKFQKAKVSSITPRPISSKIVEARHVRWLCLSVKKKPGASLISIEVVLTIEAGEMNCVVLPDRIKDYNKKSIEYKLFTRHREQDRIPLFIDQRIIRLSNAIVGREKNPYYQAKKIYAWLMKKDINVGLVHGDTVRDPLQYLLRKRVGHCGMVSAFFVALCRAQGIPSRLVNGCLLFLSRAGNHAWAEFYLSGYGWIPVDVGDGWMCSMGGNPNSYYYQYYFGNMPHAFVFSYSPTITGSKQRTMQMQHSLNQFMLLYSYEQEKSNRFTLRYLLPKEYVQTRKFAFKVTFEVIPHGGKER